MGSCTFKKSKVIKNRQSVANMGTRITLLDRFGAKQANLLLDIFHKHSSKIGLDIRSFQQMFPDLNEFPIEIINSVFKIFDFDNTGHVSFSNFCVTVSQYLVGKRVEKCKFLFRVFDLNGNGTIEGKELQEFRKYMRKVLRQNDTSYSRAEAEKTIEIWKKINLSDFTKWSFVYMDFHKALIPFEVIPSPNSEKEILNVFLMQNMQEGSTWFLISARWLDTWKSYVGFEKETEGNGENDFQSLSNMRSKSILPASRPVEITNSEIQDPTCPEHIREDCKYPEDFIPIHSQVWKELLSWYGGGPEFPRQVIKNPSGQLDVEWFPFVIKIHVSRRDLRTLVISKTESVSDVIFKISGNGKGRLYIVKSSGLKLLKPEKGVGYYFTEKIVKCIFQDSGEASTPLLKDFIEIDHEFQFAIDENIEYEEDGQWLSGFIKEINEDEYIIGASWRSKPVKIMKSESFRIRKPSRKLITSMKTTNSTGLVNLGNTCYMNSILQCLNNTPLLSRFFSFGNFYKLVNKRNPESSQGEITRVFATLIKNLSSGCYGRVRPYEFYDTFSHFYTLFQGNEQQDAHEFLRILLDSLHEDLSRHEEIKTSKTITLNNPSVDSEKLSGADHWQKIQGNVGSIISDFCAGQSRNKITCKKCGNYVIIFEMFMDLSLPIPTATPEISVTINFFNKQLSNCTKIKLNLKRDCPSELVLQKMRKFVEFLPENIAFFSYRKKVLIELKVIDLMNHLDSDLYAYELTKETGGNALDKNPNEEWLKSLKKGDCLDYKSGDFWVSARITNISPKGFEIISEDNLTNTVNIEKESGLVSPFKSGSKKIKMVFPKLYSKRYINKDLDTFGLPLVLSLQSNLSFKDLRKTLENLAYQFSGISRVQEFLKFFALGENNNCCICSKVVCIGCEIPNTFQSISSFPDGFYLIIIWKSFIMYKPKIEERQEIESININKCLSGYSSEENIEFTCAKCGAKSCLSKTSVYTLPDLLIIHLKRFRFDGTNAAKINNMIEFPLTSFDLNVLFAENTSFNYDYTQGNAKDNSFYDLFAVVNHSGNVYGGHYTSTCLVEGLKKWFYYDDDHVYELQGNVESEIVTNKAYILFYKRQRMSSSSLIQLSNYY